MSTTKSIFSKFDKLGFFIGTVTFMISFPVVCFMSAVPMAFISNIVENKILTYLIIGTIFMAALFVNLVCNIIFGLGISSTLGFIENKTHFLAFLSSLVAKGRPIEACSASNVGALIGSTAAMLLFILKGDGLVQTIANRVHHLFPMALNFQVGDVFSFDVANSFSSATGFMTIGMLFFILGTSSGNFLGLFIDRVVHIKYSGKN